MKNLKGYSGPFFYKELSMNATKEFHKYFGHFDIAIWGNGVERFILKTRRNNTNSKIITMVPPEHLIARKKGDIR